MSDIKLYTLQSGYVVDWDEHLVKNVPDQASNINNAIRLNSPNLPDTEDAYHYSPAIDDLYSMYIRFPKMLNNFDFKNRLFETAISLLTSKGVMMFITMQEKSKHITATHVMFLEEIVRFILTGRQTMNLVSWMRMIKIEEGGLIGRTINTKRLMGEFTASAARGKPVNLDILSTPAALDEWITKDNGLEHLLVTMKIIFGNSATPYLKM